MEIQGCHIIRNPGRGEWQLAPTEFINTFRDSGPGSGGYGEAFRVGDPHLFVKSVVSATQDYGQRATQQVFLGLCSKVSFDCFNKTAAVFDGLLCFFQFNPGTEIVI